MSINHAQSNQTRRARRTHARTLATAKRPKLVLTRSNKAIYLQVVDHTGRVSLATSDLALLKAGTLKKGLPKTKRAAAAGQALAQALKQAQITSLAVDRGSYKFHGRLKAAVTQIRESGIEV